MTLLRHLLLPLALLLATPTAYGAEVSITPTPEQGEKASQAEVMNALELATTTPGLTAYSFTTPWEGVKGPDAVNIPAFIMSAQTGVTAGLPALFNLYLIDTSQRALPAEMRKSKWGTQAMLLQFDTMLTNLAPKLGSAVQWVSLANNADIYFTKYPNELADFLTFYKQAANVAQRRFPNVKIGLTVSYAGLSGERKDVAEQLIAASDALFVSYSPFDDKKLKDAAKLDEDLKNLLTLTSGKSLVLQDFGYPSDKIAGGSDKAQAEFLATYLPPLRAAPQVGLINLFGLHDLDKGGCKDFLSKNGIKDRNVSAGYCSMGLLETNGKKKPAWKEVKSLPPIVSTETQPTP